MFNVLRIISLLVCLNSASAWSAVECVIRKGYTYQEYTMPLIKNMLTVGRDLPLGTILYKQTFDHPGMYVDCTGVDNVYMSRDYGHTPLAKANWNQQPYPNMVYETGVPGIGVVFNRGVNVYPHTESRPVNVNASFNLANTLRVEVNLVKIGPIAPGIVRAIDLPSATYKVQDTSKIIDVLRLYLSDDITIVSQTCETPDVSVDLGVSSIEPLVSGAQTEIGRKSFSVLMRNCPTFHGQLQSSLWHPTLGTRLFTEKNNDIKISFTAKNGVLDNARLIAKLDTVQPGNAPAAEGVGIALYDPSGNRYKFDGHFVNVTSPIIGSAEDIVIPLQAAYTYDTAKSKAVIKPGYANAAIEFVIQYN